MSQPVSISPQIIEALYCQALVLSDEVRAAFTLSGRVEEYLVQDQGVEQVRIALSSEGLRTTTRMMHAIAWLLNLRAYFMGELSEFQLRRHCRLCHDLQDSDPGQAALLSSEVRELIASTERFYARLTWLDRTWRQDGDAHAGIFGLHHNLTHRVEH